MHRLSAIFYILLRYPNIKIFIIRYLLKRMLILHKIRIIVLHEVFPLSNSIQFAFMCRVFYIIITVTYNLLSVFDLISNKEFSHFLSVTIFIRIVLSFPRDVKIHHYTRQFVHVYTEIHISYAQAVVCFEIRYNPPDGSCSSYAPSEIMEDEQQMLIDIEQNIANLERSLEQANTGADAGKRKGSWHSPQKSSKRGLLQRGSSLLTAEKSPDRKR